MLLSRLAHDRKGAGEPVVLIHGIGHRRQAWQPIFDRLAERYDVIAVDLAGFGESEPYPRHLPYDMDNASRDLAANFAEWGIERPHVVGNSLGGAIALELGARGLASSVTALSPAGFFGRAGVLRALLLLAVLRVIAFAPDAVHRLLAGTAFGRRAAGTLLYAHPERITRDQMYGDAVALKHSRGFFAVARSGLGYSFNQQVEVPATVAWGTRDLILPYSQATTAKTRLPKARHVALTGAGHVPMIDEPDLIIDLIDETVRQAMPLEPEAPSERRSQHSP